MTSESDHAPGPATDRRPVYPEQGRLVAATSVPLQPPRPRWLRLVSAVAISAVAAIVVFAGYWTVRLVTNVDSFDLNAGGGRTEGVADDRTGRLQILVLGSDTRSGPNAEYGSEDDEEGYGQSDVMMLLDLAEDNSVVNVLSFPRDLLVDIPSCVDGRTGRQFEERPGAMINSAIRDAGPGCAVDTVNELTGLEIDHFMLADFHAVTELSNAVGGVDVCVTEAIDEPKSGLELPAGTSSVQGEQALAFLRARAAFGDGGDLGRIQAQQAFLGSLTRKMKDEGTLRNPQRILAIADALTSNLSVDSGLASIPAMVTVADRMKDIDPGRVNFIAVPTVPAADPNRLALDAPIAAGLFTALRADADLTVAAADTAGDEGDGQPSAEDAPGQGEDPALGLVPVTVADGSGGTATGAALGPLLQAAGFTQVQDIPAPPTPLTGVYYGDGYADAARTLAAALGIPAHVVSPDESVDGIQIYLGNDALDGIDELEAPDVTGTINQTADQVSCQDTNPFG